MLYRGLDLSHPRGYKTLQFGVTHVNWILVIVNGTLGVEMFRSVRYTWILQIISIRCGTANTVSIRVVPSHVVKHDIHIYPGKIIRTLRRNTIISTVKSNCN